MKKLVIILFFGFSYIALLAQNGIESFFVGPSNNQFFVENELIGVVVNATTDSDALIRQENHAPYE